MRLMLIVAWLFLCAESAYSQATDDKEGVGRITTSEAIIDDGRVVFSVDGQSTSLELTELSPDELQYIMRLTGWGRVWESDGGSHRIVADLVAVLDDSVVLEKTDGSKITVPINRLSGPDQEYATQRKSIAQTALPDHFIAKVIAVHDGDTVTVLINHRRFRVRLDGIDAPERGQAYGTKAKRFLSELAFGKSVAGDRLDTDKYGRNVCILRIGEKRLDLELISEGLAWHYTRYSADETRAALELAARESAKNIWSELNPVPPWEWRKWSSAKRKSWISGTSTQPLESKPSRHKSQETRPPPVTSRDYWLNTKSMVRHNSSCRWFGNTKHGRPCTKSEGRPCGKCGGAP